MIVTIQAGVSVSRRTRQRAALALRLALAPFLARVARATLRFGSATGAAEGEVSHVRVSLTLRASGLIRAEARGLGVQQCTALATRRAAAAVARRLASEQQELLELLLLASSGAGSGPTAPWGRVAA